MIDSKDYKGKYIVYSDGRIWSNVKNSWLKISKTKGGYSQLTIGKERWQLHRLIATLWIPNPNNYPLVMHLDNNPSNNHPSNLQWATYSQNNKHAYQSGKKVCGAFSMDFYGDKHHSSKLTKDKVIAIRNSKLSQQKLADMYGVSRTTIRNVLSNKVWKEKYLTN
jgi:hypothetical protein